MAVISTLIITAASASAGRIADRTKKQQVILAAQSVAEILTDSYNNMNAAVYVSPYDKSVDLKVPYGTFLDESLRSVLKTGSPSAPVEKSSVTVSAPEPASEMKNVKLYVSLAMEGEGDDSKPGNTVCVITAEDGSYSYSVSLLLAADIQKISSVNQNAGTERLKVSWYVSEVTKGNLIVK